MQLEHVVLDELQEVLLDFEGCELVEVEETREEQRDRRVAAVDLFSRSTFDGSFSSTLVTHLDQFDLAFEHFFVHLKRQLMNDVDVRVEALGYNE